MSSRFTALKAIAARAVRLATLRPVLAGAGLVAVGVLAIQVGPEAIWSAFRALSWRLLLIVVFPTCLAVVVDTLGWRFTFRHPPRSFRRLLGARLAGEAVNLGTPTASVGGEPVKAYLLRADVPMRDGLTSVVVDKTTGVVSQVLLLLAGLLVGSALLTVPRPLMLGLTGALVLEALCVAGFIFVQLRGAVGGSGRLLAKLRLPPSRERQATLDHMDQALRATYAGNAGGVAASAACHFVGWALGTFEIYLVVRLLGIPISLATAFTIGAFGTAAKFFSFMLPGSLGALEGANVALFATFGLSGALGLTYTLVRRLREIAWVALGFLALNLMSPRAADAARPEGRATGIAPRHGEHAAEVTPRPDERAAEVTSRPD